jgi:hypothetical protein
MIELSQLTLLIMIEVILGLAFLSGVLLYFVLTRKGRIRKAALHLSERVQNDKPARDERLKSLLSNAYGLSGQELEQVLHNITQAEMLLFQNLINGYMKDNQVVLQQVDVDEENLVLAYQGLKPVAGAAAQTEAAAAGDEEEMQRLKDENQRLSDELRVTMDTMGRMLNEYSSMFAGGADKPLTRTPSVEPPAATAQTAEASEIDATDIDATVVMPQPASEDVDSEVEIPDFQASDMLVEPVSDASDKLLDSEDEAESTLDEEVSEIIDEVMEMADEMHQEERAAPQAAPADNGESLLDELEQVDIEPPAQEQAQEQAQEAEPETTPEPGSLEEEWAKLLAEDATGKPKSDKEQP